MGLLFPKITLLRFVVFTALLVFCLVGGDPFAVSPDGLVQANPLVIVGAAVAGGIVSGGMNMLGQHMARKAHEGSALGKAEAAIAKEQGKIAKTPLQKLGYSEGQKRKAMTMALEQARSQKRQLEAEQARGKDYRGPARSGVEAIQDVQLRQGMLQAGAAARANIEAQSAQLALQRKQGAIGTVMPMAQAARASQQQFYGAMADAGSGALATGLAVGAQYGGGKSSTAGTQAGTATQQ